jgi:hypothetical protein
VPETVAGLDVVVVGFWVVVAGLVVVVGFWVVGAAVVEEAVDGAAVVAV